MLSMRRVSSALWLLALASLAEAQLLPHRNYVFNGDSRVIVSTSISCAAWAKMGSRELTASLRQT